MQLAGLAEKILKTRGKNLVSTYFHGNKCRCKSRFYLLLGIFCCQRLFLEKLERKSEMWLLNLMHSVLLVRLGFLRRELMGHEGVMEPLHR